MNTDSLKKYLFAYLSGAATLVIGLCLLGRRFWCACGKPMIFAWNPASEHNSQHIVDFYSPSHFIHGLCFYLLFSRSRLNAFARFVCILVLESSWELLENSSIIIERYRAVTASLGYSGDSIANSLSDLSFCALGFLIASRVRWQVSVGLFVALELGTTMMIRDGFILNVIMLLWPMEAIRHWQGTLG
ncbi:MAG: DUF2585 family protein [Bdellovibrionota bacterium]